MKTTKPTERPDLQVVYRRPEELVPYARNARTHSPEQVQRIAASIREFGFTQPILLDGENGVLAGHGRLAAAQLLTLERVPTIDLTGLTQAQQRAYILADNRIALDAGWDEAMLGIEIEDLSAMDFDLSVTGFSEDEIEQALAGTPESELPELSTEDGVKELTMTLNPTEDEMETIKAAIAKAKEKHGLKGTNNAPIIAKICEDWLDVHG